MRITTRGMAVVAALGLLGACGRETGPGDPGAPAPAFQTARVEAGVGAVNRASASPVLGSFEALGRFVGQAGLTPVEPATGPATLAQAAARIGGVVAGTGAALVPVMRPSVFGTTYVFDPAARRYVADPGRTGAPANGVRFILYEVAGEPAAPVPGREIGHADLTDERASDPTTAGIRFVVVSGGVTHLRYTLDLSGSVAAARFVVGGFLSDGTERVDFTVRLDQPLFGRGGPATMQATLAVPAHGFEVAARVTGTAGAPDADSRVELDVRGGSDRIEVRVARVAGQLDATFTVNGRLLARATGDPARPDIRGEGGRELTAEERRALGAVLGLADGVFRTIGRLLEPAGGLLALALGLGG
jgi:hypothetical protein